MRFTDYLAAAPPGRVPRAEADPVSTADPRPSVRRLINLLQAIVPDRPAVVAALEQCIEIIVIDEMRHRIHARLDRMTPDDVAKVEAFTAQLVDEPPDEAA